MTELLAAMIGGIAGGTHWLWGAFVGLALCIGDESYRAQAADDEPTHTPDYLTEMEGGS